MFLFMLEVCVLPAALSVSPPAPDPAGAVLDECCSYFNSGSFRHKAVWGRVVMTSATQTNTFIII